MSAAEPAVTSSNPQTQAPLPRLFQLPEHLTRAALVGAFLDARDAARLAATCRRARELLCPAHPASVWSRASAALGHPRAGEDCRSFGALAAWARLAGCWSVEEAPLDVHLLSHPAARFGLPIGLAVIRIVPGGAPPRRAFARVVVSLEDDGFEVSEVYETPLVDYPTSAPLAWEPRLRDNAHQCRSDVQWAEPHTLEAGVLRLPRGSLRFRAQHETRGGDVGAVRLKRVAYPDLADRVPRGWALNPSWDAAVPDLRGPWIAAYGPFGLQALEVRLLGPLLVAMKLVATHSRIPDSQISLVFGPDTPWRLVSGATGAGEGRHEDVSSLHCSDRSCGCVKRAELRDWAYAAFRDGRAKVSLAEPAWIPCRIHVMRRRRAPGEPAPSCAGSPYARPAPHADAFITAQFFSGTHQSYAFRFVRFQEAADAVGMFAPDL